VTGAEILARLEAKGTLVAAGRALGVEPDELAEVLAGRQDSWPRLRRQLADYLGVDRAVLFPDFASYDKAFDRFMARRGGRRLPPDVVDKAVAILADVRTPPRARARK
jgi:lambda repressor-like predicted transcriptional regulator